MSDSKGIDDDLQACLECNPQGYGMQDIKQVHAVVEGERDECDWHWLLELTNGQWVSLAGGCDYTGWD